MAPTGSTPHRPARKFFIDARRSGWHAGHPGVPINLRASFMAILAVAWRPDFLNSSVSFFTFLCGEDESVRAFFFPVRPIAFYLIHYEAAKNFPNTMDFFQSIKKPMRDNCLSWPSHFSVRDTCLSSQTTSLSVTKKKGRVP